MQNIPIGNLAVSPLNSRRHIDQAHVDALASSIAAIGLQQNLIAITDNGFTLVIAGGNRLRALFQLAQDPDVDAFTLETTVPVLVYDDMATALAAGVAENAVRMPIGPVEEMRAYATVIEHGVDETGCARAFGVTARHVRQRLKLAKLPDVILDEWQDGNYDVSLLQQLTMAEDDASALAAWEEGKVRPWRVADMLKLRNLFDHLAEKIAAVGGEAAVKAAGIDVEFDLFGDTIRFAEGAKDQFHALAFDVDEKNGAERAQALGVKRVLTGLSLEHAATLEPEHLDMFDAADDAEAKEIIASCDSRELAPYLTVTVSESYSNDGTVYRLSLMGGDRNAAIEDGALSVKTAEPDDGIAPDEDLPPAADSTPDEPLSSVSAKLADALRRLPSDAAAVLLMKKTDVMLDYLAYALVNYGKGLTGHMRESEESGLLEVTWPDLPPAGGTFGEWLTSVPRAKSKAVIALHVLASVTPAAGQSLIDHIGKSVRDAWTPDALYLDGLNKAQLQALAKDTDMSTWTDPPRKGDMVEELATGFAAGEAKDWLPPQLAR